MSGWFGKSWGAEVCRGPHYPTPMGKQCDYFRCGEPIEPGDCGIVMPLYQGDDKPVRMLYYHLDCQLRSVGVPPCPDPNGPGCTCDQFKHVKGYPHVRHLRSV